MSVDAKLLESLDEIRQEVGEWAFRNFGDQGGLGSLAPLLGMCEEVGEKEEAPDLDEFKDSLADIAIFLCDFVHREGGSLTDAAPYLAQAAENVDKLGHARAISAAVGGLSHACLKRHQRIRRMNEPEVFNPKRDYNIARLIVALDRQCNYSFMTSIQRVMLATWATVKQRNWVANPCSAHEIAAQAVEANS